MTDAGRKIKTVEELRKLLGPRPRRRKVVLCHGVFDLVHPGHIRHLLYAKSKASILVASLTADEHIGKGPYRPYVPQDLRAFNLAALEAVDYVVIDTEATPLRLLDTLQPEIFAKGYEYQDGHPHTAEERVLVDSYGGQILFTPGDVVYSSSAIIESAPPKLTLDKLVTLMDAEGVTFGNLRSTLDGFAGVRVHVVGDTIVDSIAHTTLIGGGTKTPTLSVRHERQEDFVGGAAVVALHLAAAGARVTFTTVLGDDEPARFVVTELQRSGIDFRAIIDQARPTTHKNTIVCAEHRLLKVDKVDNATIPREALQQITQAMGCATEAVVFSDFRHGIFNRSTIPVLSEAIPRSAVKVADSQVASRWGNILDFTGFDLLTPNEREARFALADQDIGIRPLATQLREKAQCKTLIMKLGERGILTAREEDERRAFFVVDSFARHVVDPVGAGDALLAYATLAMVSGGDVVASILGSIAAAVECEADGNRPVSRDDVMRRLGEIEAAIL